MSRRYAGNKLETSIEALNLHISYIEQNMVTKDELAEIRAEIRDAKFHSNKINWVLTSIVGAAAFVLGFIF